MEILGMCRRLEALAGDWERAMAGAVFAATQKALETAREEVPVDTGALKDSLQMAQAGLEGSIQTGKEYAVYVELGTARSAAQPFLRPAFLAGAETFRREAAAAIFGGGGTTDDIQE